MKKLILLAALALVGCGGESLDDNPEVMVMLPDNASSVQDIGNGWVVFDWSSRRYLMSPAGSVALFASTIPVDVAE